jgi:hypothetical protein
MHTIICTSMMDIFKIFMNAHRVWKHDSNNFDFANSQLNENWLNSQSTPCLLNCIVIYATNEL